MRQASGAALTSNGEDPQKKNCNMQVTNKNKYIDINLNWESTIKMWQHYRIDLDLEKI